MKKPVTLMKDPFGADAPLQHLKGRERPVPKKAGASRARCDCRGWSTSEQTGTMQAPGEHKKYITLPRDIHSAGT